MACWWSTDAGIIMITQLRKLRNKLRAFFVLLRADTGPGGNRRLLTDILVKRYRHVMLRFRCRRLHGPAKPPGGPNDVVATCVVRDGLEFLPTFLDHHRAIGVHHFIFCDNGSVDGSIEYLRRQPDSTIYTTGLPWADYKHLLKHFLVKACGVDRWSLILDVDECFDFPGSDRIKIGEFSRYLDRQGHNAVVGQMLELFPRGPVLAQEAPADGNLGSVLRFFDISAIREDEHLYAFGETNVVSNPSIKCHSCGINLQAFGNDTLLTKHPMIRWSPPMELPKYSHDISYARIADVSAVLLHYKFTSGLTQVIERAIVEGSYYMGSERYKNIARTFEENPELSLRGPTAHELRSIDDLVAHGFLVVSQQYRKWLEERMAALTEGSGKFIP